MPDEYNLSPRDAAFAHAMYDITLRRWITCRFIVEQFLNMPWPKIHPAAKAALLGGTAQILFMRSVPGFAAVDASVEWTKSVSSIGTSGLVNAVLRRVLDLLPEGAAGPAPGSTKAEMSAMWPAKPEDAGPELVRAEWTDRLDELPLPGGGALVLRDEILPEDPIERLAVTTSHPMALLRSWLKLMKLREVRALAVHGLATPPVILNTQFATEELPESLEVHDSPGHHVFTGSREDLVDILEHRKDLWVQDPASSLAVESIVHLKPGLIIDACAGMGTKTRQLAAAFPEAKIIATDIDKPRLRTLERTFKDHPTVTTIAYETLMDYAGQADLVFLDVPCSNTGVLARRVEARYRHDRQRTDELTAMQRQILADSIRLLARDKRGSRIVYSTCSLDPQENSEMALWAKRWHSFEIDREHRRMPAGGPGLPATAYTDGSYAVVLG